MMRDFSWSYFTNTGCIDAYMLYTEHKNYLDQQMMQEMVQGDPEEPLSTT